MNKICLDLYCGLGGFSEGFLAEHYDVIGVDIERHDYGTGGYPGELIIADVRTLRTEQFRSVIERIACVVASPPCTEYSYMAMPWKRAKQIAAALRGDRDKFPEGYKGSRSIEELNALFNECWRIQKELSALAGRYIPMVVENVKGAQPWVGEAKANFGSFYLWGDVGRVGNRVVVTAGPLGTSVGVRPAGRPKKFNPDGTAHPQGSWFAIADSKTRGAAQKCPGFRFDGSGKSFQSESVKVSGQDWNHFNKTGKVSPHWRMQATKNEGGSWFNVAHNTESGKGQNPDGRKINGSRRERELRVGEFGWHKTVMADGTSKSEKRKAASAMIAKIPLPLARYVAQVFALA